MLVPLTRVVALVRHLLDQTPQPGMSLENANMSDEDDADNDNGLFGDVSKTKVEMVLN